MVPFVVSIVGGASLGGIYVLVALGMVLAYRATSTISFSHGQLMLLPAFATGEWTESRILPIWAAISIAIVGTSALGGLFYIVVLQHTTGLPHFMSVIATFGLAIMIDGAVILLFSQSQYSITLPGLSTGVTSVLGARVATSSLEVTAFTLALAGAIMAVLRFTSLGRSIRAVGQDPFLATYGGMNVRLLHLFSWAVSAGLAAIAGIAYASTHPADSTLVDLMLAAFPAMLIGGFDSIGGAIVGGLLIGIFQGFVQTYYSPNMLNVATYALLLVVMLIIPQGLWGTRSATRV
jgi:branched-chain amino acid transport system permease protein